MTEETTQVDNNNLFPGTKFTIKDSEDVFTLIGYTSDRNIVYFNDNNDDNNHYINNIQVSNKNIINKIIFIQKSQYQKKLYE
jgi:hypothetical protein